MNKFSLCVPIFRFFRSLGCRRQGAQPNMWNPEMSSSWLNSTNGFSMIEILRCKTPQSWGSWWTCNVQDQRWIGILCWTYVWSGASCEPYVADDVQVQFYMMSPYVLKTLSTDTKIPVQPCRHNEYERFMPAAYPYYGAAFSMIAGFFIFTIAHLHSK